MEKRIFELETKVAFQEHTLQQLNDVVTRQQFQIEQLAADLKTLKARLSALAPTNIASESEETPPPHY